MRRTAVVAMILGGAFALAYLPGLVRRERCPVAPPVVAAAAPVAAPAPPPTAASGGDLKEMLAVGRKARLERRTVSAAEQRRALTEATTRGSADARTRALQTLALQDRAAADELARAGLGDHVLFATSARLLLVRPDGAVASADLARVRKALRTGEHDEASRAAVAALVLDTLVTARSPAVPAFVASLRADPSARVQAVVAGHVVAAPRGAKPRRRASRA